MAKYVILLNFYVSLLQKHKNIKKKKYKINKDSTEHFYLEISNHK